MDGIVLYTLCVLGALGLYLVLRPGGLPIRAVGGLIGLAAFVGLLFLATTSLAGDEGARPGVFFVIFSLIAIASGVKLITHTRPVYSALYFILVVLASAGLFLLLQAEFMAFALIIVYAGAILITYMFVIMLAQQAPDPHNPSARPEYDLVPREPFAGVAVGFILLALLSHMVSGVLRDPPAAPSLEEARVMAWQDLVDMPEQLKAIVLAEQPGVDLAEDAPPQLEATGDGTTALVRYTLADGTAGEPLELTEDALPENIQQVGLALILKFREGQLELAGVILLMAMFGAVVLARKQIELSEDEKRQAAGMRRLGHEDDPEDFHAAEGSH
ncbi:MAG: NADH-quinone oxidoreductase subunit J [Phycisphaerales bacterium]|nr:MAG: NADH-quinone oxidoreductase subunit J [Phycisphaerales bacterium]